MTESVLPTMRRQGEGRIVNIASIGGRVSMPHMLPYSASKYALVGWSQGLAAELRRFNILVTTVSPGLMRTGSPRRATFKGRHRQEYAWFSIGASLPVVATDSALAAKRIIDGCRNGDPIVMVSAFSHLAARGHGLCPGLATRLLSLINDWLPRSGHRGRRAFPGWQSQSTVSPSWLTVLNERAAVRNHEI
jgi:NAD(P)-dependent dehydrogenase (short-subunit alcohol dehydrogenase family)